MNFHEKTMENIGQANVFHEFMVFPRFLAGPRRFSEKPQIHGKHWPGQCFPLISMKKQWKTLARPMFSMNLLNFIDSWLVPGDSLENHKFMENIGQANVFHCFFHRNSWKTLARPMFSMNSLNFIDSWLVPGDSLKNHKFMENIGQANVFHCFFTGIHGKHWPGQCFP